MQPSRRSLLLGTGSALALGVAGCLGRAAPGAQAANDGDDGLPAGLERALQYVYPPEDVAMVRITRHTVDADTERMGLHPTVDGVGDPDWVVYHQRGTNDPAGTGGIVATGEIDVDTDDRYSPDGSRGEFDRYVVERDSGDGDRILLTDGETLLLGPADWAEAALDHHESDAETYLEATPGARTVLAAVALSGQTVLVHDDEAIRQPFEQAGVDGATLPSTLAVEFDRTDESISYTLVGWYEATPDPAEAEPLQSFLADQLAFDEPTLEIDENANTVVVRGSRPYTPPEERPETMGRLRFQEYDEAADEILFSVTSGEPLPVDRYEIEIDETVYDGDWARGQSEVGVGDVIAIDADAIEPGDHLTVTYESPDGGYGSSSGMPGLRHLPFAVDYDPDERTAVITYAEGPPLRADRVSVVIGDDERTEQPWDGDLTEGDSATLADLPIDEHLVVEYERADGERVPIGHGSLRPPGEFEFAYDARAETLTVEYPDRQAEAGDRPPGAVRSRTHRDQEPLVADRFVVRVDGDPTDRQFADAAARIEPGDSLTLEGIPVDTPVSVDWVDEGGTPHEIAGYHTIPDVSFAFAYDREADELTVTHDGGPAVDPEAVAVRLHERGEERTVDWGADGAIAEGDDFVVDGVGEDVFVVVTYRERHLDRVHVREVIEEAEG